MWAILLMVAGSCSLPAADKLVIKGSDTLGAKMVPQTLFVFEHEGAEMQLKDADYLSWKEANPDAQTTDLKSFSYSGGGILPCIIGTILLTVGSMIITLTLGIFAAIFLSEYAKPGTLLNSIRLSILNLAGVPSIVFRLFGLGMFVLFFGWNVSLLAGCFTLAFMVLPVIITASEEAMRSIPQGFREGSLALGATKWTAIRTNVLPYALPGILTSILLRIRMRKLYKW